MPVIEEIKRNKSSITIVVDGVTQKGVNIDAALMHNLKKGYIDDSAYAEFLRDNDKENCKAYVMAMIARKARTEKEVRVKLKEKGFMRPSIENAVKIAKAYGYISDEEYARNYVETCSSHKGGYRLKQELRAKGIADEYVESAVAELSEEEEEAAAFRLTERYMRGKTMDDKVKEKLFRYLCSRGFGYDVIKSVMHKYGMETD